MLEWKKFMSVFLLTTLKVTASTHLVNLSIATKMKLCPFEAFVLIFPKISTSHAVKGQKKGHMVYISRR